MGNVCKNLILVGYQQIIANKLGGHGSKNAIELDRPVQSVRNIGKYSKKHCWWDMDKSTHNKYIIKIKIIKLNYVSATDLYALLVLIHLILPQFYKAGSIIIPQIFH